MKDELIAIVFNYPAIWDKNHKQHHNRHVLAMMWTKIAAKMGATERDVRNCWKNLRQEFGKQLRKLEHRPADDSSDGCQWPYFSKLLFLQDQFNLHEMSNNLADTRDESSTLSAANNADSDSEFYFHIDEDNCMSLTHHSTQSLPSPSSDLDPGNAGVPTGTVLVPATNSSNHIQDVVKTGYKRRMISHRDEVSKQMHEQNNSSRSCYDNSDEDMGFFNSLLPHVRRLSPRDKLVFRMKVQQTLFEIAFPSDKSTQS